MEGLNHSKRQGRFTSSQAYRIVASLKSGKPSSAFQGYIKEVKIERFLNRRTKTSVNTKATKWGKLMEVVLFNKLGLNYSMSHIETVLHPEYGDFWSGTPDLIAKDKTAEIKCFEPMHFGKMVMALESKDLEVIKEEEKEAYWQSVSNSILKGFDKTELIAYMPYKSDLLDIITMIEETDFCEKNNLNPFDYYTLRPENIEDYPYLPDDSKVSDINQFEFVIPQEDKDLLTQRMIEANKILNE